MLTDYSFYSNFFLWNQDCLDVAKKFQKNDPFYKECIENGGKVSEVKKDLEDKMKNRETVFSKEINDLNQILLQKEVEKKDLEYKWKTRETLFSKERDDLNQILLQKENKIKEFQKANADLQSKINQTHLPIPNNDQNEIKELKDKINKLEKQIEGYI